MPRESVAILAALGVLLVLFQYTALPKLAFTVGARWSLPDFLENLTRVPWSALDQTIFVAMVGLVLSLIYLEVRRQRVCLLLEWVFRSERSTIVFTALVLCVSVRYYFSSGDLTWGGDAAYHTLYAWIAAEGFKAGTIPVWTPLVSAGTPFLQFYGFTFFYAIGLLDLLVDHLDTTIKIALGLAHTASGLAVYLLTRIAFRSRLAGFVAALAYTLSFWHLQQVLVMGRYPISLIYLFLPIPFCAVECMRQGLGKPPVCSAVLGGSIALLFWTHPAYAAWSFCLLLAFIVICRARPNRFSLRHLGVGVAGGLIFASYLVVPMLIERGWTNLEHVIDLTYEPPMTWQHLFIWSNHRTRLFPLPEGSDHWHGGYLGISLALLCAYGLVRRIRSRRSLRVSDWPYLGLVAATILVNAWRIPFVRDFEAIQSMGSGRFLLFVVFFLSGCVAFACREHSRVGGTQRLLPILLAVIALDLGTTTVRQPYHFSREKAYVNLGSLKEDLLTHTNTPRQFSSSRFFHSYHPVNNLTAAMGRRATIYGPYHEHPRADDRFIKPFLDRAVAEVGGSDQEVRTVIGSPVGSILLEGFHLLATQYFLRPKPGGGIVQLDFGDTSPIIVSNELRHAQTAETASDPFMILSEMRVYPVGHRADRILIPDRIPEAAHPEPATIQLHGHETRIADTSIRFSVSGPAFVRLSYAYYPFLAVRLNGKQVDVFETLDGFVGLAVPPGEHHLSIEGHLSPARRVILALIGCLSLGIVLWSRRKTRR